MKAGGSYNSADFFAESVSLSSGGNVLAVGSMQERDSDRPGYVTVVEFVDYEW